jgi:adenine nucleotide transporter 17
MVNVLLTTPLWVANTRLKLQGVKLRSQNLENITTPKYTGIIGKNSLHVYQVCYDKIFLCVVVVFIL